MKIVILIISLALMASNEITSTPAKSLIEKYKEVNNPLGNHSLFTGNNGDRISKYYRGVPPPLTEM